MDFLCEVPIDVRGLSVPEGIVGRVLILIGPFSLRSKDITYRLVNIVNVSVGICTLGLFGCQACLIGPACVGP